MNHNPPTGYEFCEETGALKSISREITASYDHDYVARYENYPQAELSAIRAKLVMKYAGDFATICDVGFGTGAFLAEISRAKPTATLHGFDVSPYPAPDFVNVDPDWQQKEWDVVTFFDSLEHFVDLPKVNAKCVVVSVPWYHRRLGNKWFDSWKHRRPGEHLWHFSSYSLGRVFENQGIWQTYLGNPEDKIRKSDGPLQNILTMIFSR
jgi:hypothetical protein